MMQHEGSLTGMQSSPRHNPFLCIGREESFFRVIRFQEVLDDSTALVDDDFIGRVLAGHLSMSGISQVGFLICL